MNFKERIYSILVVSAADKFNASLSELLEPRKYSPIRFEASINAAKRALAEREYDLVIVNSPLPDDDGFRFAIDTCSDRGLVVMLLVRNEIYASAFDKVSAYGVYTLPKPTARQIILQGLDWMISARERLRRFEKKTLSIEDKMQEIRIVNRAKWLLITELKMTEADAHRYIEKRAMDSCIPKKDVACKIISTYS